MMHAVFCRRTVEKWDVRAVLGTSVVIFVPDDTRKTGRDVPLMLERVQGAPLLAWLTAALAQDGARRFFLVAQPGCMARAKACFPQDLDLTVCAEQNPADLLHVFLSTTEGEEEQITVVTGPAVYLSVPAARLRSTGSQKPAAFFASRQGLMEALDQDFSFSRFLVEQGNPCTQDDGFYAVSDFVELLAWQKAMNQNQLFRLAQQGVRIWDLDHCYVSPWSAVGNGTELLPGVILTGRNSVGSGCTIGPDTYLSDCSVADGARVVSSRAEGAVIGPDCEVGPFANLRTGTCLGPAVKAGAFVEMKETQVGARTQVAHLTYLGDASVGQDCNVGCGVATANFDRVDKHETVLEDGAFIGCHTSLVAPVRVGQGAYIGAGSVITQDVPAGALGVARSRQTNKKEWANRHKK